jgi:RNA polymerase sigma factor (sigma-70 family)
MVAPLRASTGMGQSDDELLAATAAGDADAFGRFYRRHERQVLTYAMLRCSNSGDVADLVAETFLAAMTSAGRYRPGHGDAGAWLLGIARHALSRQRRTFARRRSLVRRLANVPAFCPDEADAVDTAIDAARLAPKLRAALAGLQAKDRELLLLVARDGLEPARAGAVLGMNPNTARLRLSRARKRLRVSLDDPAPATHEEASDAHS